MSRHSIATTNPNYRCYVGWDDPLETFFAQVVDISVDEYEPGHMVLWLGALPNDKIATVDELKEKIEEYAVIPEITAKKLQKDYEQRTAPSPFQMQMRKMMEGL